MVNADGTKALICFNENSGHTGEGRPVGRLGNLVPMVSISIEKP